MKKRIISLLTLAFLLSLLASALNEHDISRKEITALSSSYPQTTKKPKYDYMSTILSRDTKPLGLKENIALKKFLKQPNIKWAIRAGERHILD